MGIVGSLHCLGMCGPIALGLSGSSEFTSQPYRNSFYYNAGRTISYSFMGLILGLIGSRLALAGYQQMLSIGAGLFILFVFFFGYWFNSSFQILKPWNSKIQTALGNMLNKPKTIGYYLEIGLINAWLPCGLVYLALASSMSMANAWYAALFMLAFGIGTSPLMASLMIVGNKLSFSFRHKIAKIIPVFIIITAVLLILRGMNLGIPFISPEIDKVQQCVRSCCHK